MKLIQAIKNQPPDHIALQDATNVIRYGELLSCINDRAQDLVDTDVKVLGLALDNSVEWVLWDLAAQQAGVVCVPLAPFFSPDQTKHVMESAGITYIIDPQGLRASGLTVANGFSNIPAGTHKITYTSGTTGAPKGVCLPQSAMDNVAESIVGFLGDTRIAKGSHLCVLPLSVLLENVAGVYAALMAGCSIRFTALSSLGENYSELHTLLSNTKATSIILVPEILRSLMAQVLAKGLLPDLNFIAVGGAKIDPALLDQAEHLGLPVYEGYGLSECGSVVSLNTPEESRRGSVGKLLPHIHARIEAGEVLITDPGFLGYLGEPMVDDFATGDLGGLCADGYLSITGRKKNVLITAYGRNISPEWLESLLLSQPQVAQAMVYGDGEPHLSALIVVTGTDHRSAAPAAVVDHIQAAVDLANSGLPEYARIRSFQCVPAFTLANKMLTGTGRPRRDVIAKRYLLKDPSVKQFHKSFLSSTHSPAQEKAMSFYDELNQQTACVRQQLYSVPQLVDGLSGKISRETYIAYLTEAYHHVSHTVPFLMAMGMHLPKEKYFLQKSIAHYIQEEVGHEEWILNDIEAAGGDKELARTSMPNLETQVLIAYNNDYIQRKNPVGFLGMVFMLESTSVQIANRGADALTRALGLPKKAFSYLYSHGELDINHMEFFKETLKQVEAPEDQKAIIEVAQNTFRLFASVLQSIPHKGEQQDAA